MTEIYMFHKWDKYGNHTLDFTLDVPRGASANSVLNLSEEEFNKLKWKTKQQVDNILEWIIFSRKFNF